nr:diguanylate cyclase [Halomonas sp.]
MRRFSHWRLKNRLFAGFMVIGLVGGGLALFMGLAISNIYTDFRRFTLVSEQVELGYDLATKMVVLQRLSEKFIQEGDRFSADQADLALEQAETVLAKLEDDASEPIRRRAGIMAVHLDNFQQAFAEVKRQRERQNQLTNDAIHAEAELHGKLIDSFAARILDAESVALVERLRISLLQIEGFTRDYFDSLDNALIREVKGNVRHSQALLQQLQALHQGDSFNELLTRMDASILAYEEAILEAVQRSRGYLFLVNVVMAAETYEILYQSDRLTEKLRQEMLVIEESVDHKRQLVFLLALIGSVIMLLLIVGLSYALGRSIATPIENLAGIFRRLARGETAPIKSDYEVGYELQELSRASEVFREKNAETQQLLARYREISGVLEEKVKERTQALEEANQQLKELSRTDGLTGLANRRYFEEILGREWLTAQRNDLSLTVIMLDIDYFKAFNDRYGHPAGDQCLREVARELKQHARRGNDMAARYGGEEFIVILQDSDQKAGVAIAERIRCGLEALDIAHEDAPIKKVTASFGVAAGKPAEGFNSAFELIKQADDALYQAKQTGRNRVVAAAT